MFFNRRENEAHEEVIGEATFVDPSESITEIREEIEGYAEPELVATTAVIGETIVIKGEVSGDEDLRVEGRVEGSVSMPKSRLTVGSSGNIHADVNAKTLNVEGHIDGDVSALEKVVLKSTGHMQGNIKAPRITLEDGCKFNGTISMDSEPSAVVTDIKTPAQTPTVKTTTDKQAV